MVYEEHYPFSPLTKHPLFTETPPTGLDPGEGGGGGGGGGLGDHLLLKIAMHVLESLDATIKLLLYGSGGPEINTDRIKQTVNNTK